MASMTLNEPVYKVLPGGQLSKYYEARTKHQEAVNAAIGEVSRTLGVSDSEVAIGNGEPYIETFSDAATRYDEELKVSKDDYRSFKKSYLKKHPELTEACATEKRLSDLKMGLAFAPLDIFQTYHGFSSQTLDGVVYVGPNRNADPERIKGEAELVNYSDYLKLVAEAVARKGDDSIER